MRENEIKARARELGGEETKSAREREQERDLSLKESFG